jgi:hypothetical protein
MNGQTSQRTSSGLFPLSLSNSLVRYILLYLIGAVAMVIHARLRLHLGIPGHQGFIYMALLVGASSVLHTRFSGLAFAAGSSTILAFGILGFANPFIFAEFLFVGLVADILMNVSKTSRYKVIFILLVGALGYGMIPVIRLITTSVTGYPYGSFLKFGFGLTLLSYIVFGMAGALSGFGISKLFPSKKK